jgi:integrase
MPSVWIRRRLTAKGKSRFIVEYRIGGRGRPIRYGGSFTRATEATARRNYIAGELAALRVPDLRLHDAEPVTAPTLKEAAEGWRWSRIDVSEGTKLQHRSSIQLMLDRLGPSTPVAQISAADVAAAVTELAETRKRETIRKAVNALRMTLDHAGVEPNPCDKTVRLPFQRREEISPPTAAHLLAAHRLLPSRYRLPLLVLDATGMRLGELERLTWGDVDETRRRWRVSAAVSKTGRARWIDVHEAIFQAVLDLCPRDDRTPTRPVFQGFNAAAFRTRLGRVCVAAGVPAFSPHDLRHRRISLLLRGGIDPVTVSRHVGHAKASMSLDTYGHVLVEDGELDYAALTAVA